MSEDDALNDLTVRPIQTADLPWLRRVLIESWGAVQVVARGRVHQADALPAFVAVRAGQPLGLATYCVAGPACELVTLDSLARGTGVGTALVAAVAAAARDAGCRRLWLITTNDNLTALRFYQKRGFVLVALHRDALAESRRLKPSIPLVGLDGIPLRDELELELPL